MKATTQTLRLVAAIALAFAATTATAAAKKPEVKITNSNGEPLFGYWVEYELNGVKYRSDRACVRMNQIAWEYMSDADRETTVRNVYGVFNARKDQFGDKAEELGYWYDKKKGWVQGAETLADGIVKRDFPELYEKMTSGKGWGHGVPDDGRPRMSSPEIDKIKEEADLVRSWAQEAFKTLKRAAYIRTSVGVKAISGGLIELITDKVLVPNITPAGAGGLLASAIGTALDYVNNVTGLQSKIIDSVVAKRPSTEQTLAVVNNCDMAIAQSRGFIDLCEINYDKLMDEYDKKCCEYGAEMAPKSSAEFTAWTVAHDRMKEAADEAGVASPALASEYRRLRTAIDKVKRADYDSDKEYEAAVKARWRDLRDWMVSQRGPWEARAKAWCSKMVGSDYVEYDHNTDDPLVYILWLGNTVSGRTMRIKRRGSSPISSIATAFVDIMEPNHPGAVYSLKDEIRAEMKRGTEKYISELEKFYAAREALRPRIDETCQSAMTEYYTLLRDRGMLDNDGLPPDMIVPWDLDSPTIEEIFSLICDVWKHCDMSLDNFNKEVKISHAREELKKMEEQTEQYRKNLQAYDKYLTNNESYTALSNAKKIYDEAYKALNGFLDTMPSFVAEQEVGYVSDYHNKVFPPVNNDGETDPFEGYIVLNNETELGRAFLAEDAKGTAGTASAYRKRLNELDDQYCTLRAKADHAEEVLKAHLKAYRHAVGIGNDAFGRYQFVDDNYEDYRFVLDPECSGLLTGYAELQSSWVGKNDLPLNTSGGGWAPSIPAARRNATRKAQKLSLLANDFNHRNASHTDEMSVYGILSVESNRTEFAETIMPDPEDDPYVWLSGTARNLARKPAYWTNPNSLYGYWNGGRYNLNATNEYHCGVGSYAYFAPGYYESEFGGEPDPFKDFVEPILNEIDAARQAYAAVIDVPTIYFTVTFDGNGGSVSPTTRVVTVGSAVGELPTATWSGWSFTGWYTEAHGGTKVTAATVVSANVTYYAHWTQGGGGSDGGGTVDPTEAPTLFGPVMAELPFTGDATYYGWVRNADGTLAGQLTVEAGKAVKPEKGGQSKLTVAYTPLGGRKQNIKLAKDEMPVAGEVATVTLPGVGTVKFTGDAIVGVNVDVQAGKDMLKSKDRGEKAAATAAAASKAGVWTFALNMDAGYAAFSVAVDKKGKGKLSGTLPNGTKVSLSSQGVLGDEALAVPFACTRKCSFGFVFWVKDGGKVSISDMTALRLADGTQYEAKTIAPAATGDLAEGEHTFTAEGVSQQFTVSGGRWNAPKSDRRAEVDPNPTGLKLKFKAKDGTVRGSFTVADDGGKVKYTVVGAVVGGRLYGTAYSKKAPSLPATTD